MSEYLVISVLVSYCLISFVACCNKGYVFIIAIVNLVTLHPIVNYSGPDNTTSANDGETKSDLMTKVGKIIWNLIVHMSI